MKKIIYLISAFLITANSFAQSDSTKSKISYYTSVGISISNVNKNDENTNSFNKASYPSLEIGLMRNNVSLGAVFGFENLLVSSSTRKFYELKTAIYRPVGQCTIYGLFGVGAYFEKNLNSFIEYGSGFSYAPKKVGYFVQYSSWAGTNYVSTGIVYNF